MKHDRPLERKRRVGAADAMHRYRSPGIANKHRQSLVFSMRKKHVLRLKNRKMDEYPRKGAPFKSKTDMPPIRPKEGKPSPFGVFKASFEQFIGEKRMKCRIPCGDSSRFDSERAENNGRCRHLRGEAVGKIEDNPAVSTDTLKVCNGSKHRRRFASAQALRMREEEDRERKNVSFLLRKKSFHLYFMLILRLNNALIHCGTRAYQPV